jgi:hypothetical protein
MPRKALTRSEVIARQWAGAHFGGCEGGYSVLWFPRIKSPNPAPSDYFLFSKLKSDLRGKKFTCDEVISAVSDHFKGKNSEYFFSDIQKLINRSKNVLK